MNGLDSAGSSPFSYNNPLETFIQQCIEIAIILAANRIDCRLSFYESESSKLGNLLQLLDELDAR